MSEIVERVAKAVEEELAYSIPQSAAYPSAGRAAIAAMREPTREMERAGEQVSCTSIECTCDGTLIFQAMIDEAKFHATK